MGHHGEDWLKESATIYTLDDVPDDADRVELELLSPSAKRALNRLLETASLEGVLPKRRRVALPILGPPSEV